TTGIISRIILDRVSRSRSLARSLLSLALPTSDMTDAAWLTQLVLPNRRWIQVKTWCRTNGFTPSVAQLTAMLEGGQVICRDILAEQQTIQDNNLCDLSILVPNNKGYCQPSIFGKKPMVLHKIAYL